MRYRTRSQEVEAIQYTGANSVEVRNFCSAASAHWRGDGYEWIEFVDRYGVRRSPHPGQYIVKHDDGFSVNAAEGFEKFWEPVPDLIRTVEDYEGLPNHSILEVVDTRDVLVAWGDGTFMCSGYRVGTKELVERKVVCSVVRLGGE